MLANVAGCRGMAGFPPSVATVTRHPLRTVSAAMQTAAKAQNASDSHRHTATVVERPRGTNCCGEALADLESMLRTQDRVLSTVALTMCLV